MRKWVLSLMIAGGMLVGTVAPPPLEAATVRSHTPHRKGVSRKRAHRKTLKRLGIGAAGGAAIGALAGGGKGAAIGAAVGAGSGYLYDRHKKKRGQ